MCSRYKIVKKSRKSNTCAPWQTERVTNTCFFFSFLFIWSQTQRPRLKCQIASGIQLIFANPLFRGRGSVSRPHSNGKGNESWPWKHHASYKVRNHVTNTNEQTNTDKLIQINIIAWYRALKRRLEKYKAQQLKARESVDSQKLYEPHPPTSPPPRTSVTSDSDPQVPTE